MPDSVQARGTTMLAMLAMLAVACSDPSYHDSNIETLAADESLHLEEHWREARIVGAEPQQNLTTSLEWTAQDIRSNWKQAVPAAPLNFSGSTGVVRLGLTNRHQRKTGAPFVGGIYTDKREWLPRDWASVLIQARTTDPVQLLGLGFGLRQTNPNPDNPTPFTSPRDRVPVITDGSIQTYRLQVNLTERASEDPWQQLGIWFSSDTPASLEVISIAVIPIEEAYSRSRVGVVSETRGQLKHRALFTHAPSRLTFSIRVPERGRMDFGQGFLRDNLPVTFRVTVTPSGRERTLLYEKEQTDSSRWTYGSVDLSEFQGQVVELSLETESDRAGAVGLWASPTVSGARRTAKPNVILYIIDSGDANQMSVYGYNRRTTPQLERLAKDGVVFENAYSNSRWTKVSTPSFMTSLQHSVLGGFRSMSDSLPLEATTLTERLHEAGYQTAVLVANPYAGSMSSLDRGADFLRDGWPKLDATSSVDLHERFWQWREQFPAEPYFVHFQTTDVHESFYPVPPFEGLFVDAEERDKYDRWNKQLDGAGGHGVWSQAHEKTGISRKAFFNIQRGLYDECLAHNDHQIGRLVARLKARGEWEHTLLVVASDHGMWGASDAVDLALLDQPPSRWGPMFRPSFTKIPMIFLGPGILVGGSRIQSPVSMIDVMPTILDLVGLRPSEIAQGISLAGLLTNSSTMTPPPVFLDEFQVALSTGELNGWLEIIDGRWGASLQIGSGNDVQNNSGAGVYSSAMRERPTPLLLYDLWNDPYCLHSLHGSRPELVEKYTEVLNKKFQEHRRLSRELTHPKDQILDAAQLDALRALGYIQ